MTMIKGSEGGVPTLDNIDSISSESYPEEVNCSITLFLTSL